MNLQLGDIAHIIQLSIAPVFLLTGVGTNMMVLTNRLARIIDRTRVLEDRLAIAHDDDYMAEMAVLFERSHLISYAITLSTACALMICLVIALLFVGDTLNIMLDQAIALLFVLAMVSLIGSLCYLLREIMVASKGLRMRRHIYLKIDPR
ncbi:MAG TPA: DUF2721 domain-containing protein [Burkholderiaceae bacterium]